MPELRRSPRLIASIPVNLTVVGQDLAVQGRTAVVNRHEALVLSPAGYAAETLLRIRNEITFEATACRLVWVSQDNVSNVRARRTFEAFVGLEDGWRSRPSTSHLTRT